MQYYLFVGEHPSRTAQKRGWGWCDKHLCAKTLHEALEACGITEEQYTCMNLLGVDGSVSGEALRHIAHWQGRGWQVVGLGRKVQTALSVNGVPHLAMVHPAARGRIRAPATYHAHVAAVLHPERSPVCVLP
jgi:hypothetical protein